MKTVGERCPVINVILLQKTYSTTFIPDVCRTGDVTSHCGVLNPGPCPEVWAELVLTTQEENSLFGSAIHKAIGTVHSNIQPFRTNYSIFKVQYIQYTELSLFYIFKYKVFSLVCILIFSTYLRNKTSARAASKFDCYNQ